MALKSTIFKADLQVADMDRHHYGTHALTIARHPSETDERMMVRLLAYALFADDALEFGRGLSTDDEPALWQKDLTGAIERWIEVGQPDERVLRRACGRAREVVVVTYGGPAADIWWDKNRDGLGGLANLAVFNVKRADSQALAALTNRGMSLQATIQDGGVLITGDGQAVDLHPQRLKATGATQ